MFCTSILPYPNERIRCSCELELSLIKDMIFVILSEFRYLYYILELGDRT